jgi:serine/threonine protein kinase
VAPEILSAGKGESYPSGVDMFSVGVVTYTMLCGYEPFFGVNDEELIQMNKRVEYEFEEPEWSSISDEAKDLVRHAISSRTEWTLTLMS